MASWFIVVDVATRKALSSHRTYRCAREAFFRRVGVYGSSSIVVASTFRHEAGDYMSDRDMHAAPVVSGRGAEWSVIGLSDQWLSGVGEGLSTSAHVARIFTNKAEAERAARSVDGRVTPAPAAAICGAAMRAAAEVKPVTAPVVEESAGFTLTAEQEAEIVEMATDSIMGRKPWRPSTAAARALSAEISAETKPAAEAEEVEPVRAWSVRVERRWLAMPATERLSDNARDAWRFPCREKAERSAARYLAAGVSCVVVPAPAIEVEAGGSLAEVAALSLGTVAEPAPMSAAAVVEALANVAASMLDAHEAGKLDSEAGQEMSRVINLIGSIARSAEWGQRKPEHIADLREALAGTRKTAALLAEREAAAAERKEERRPSAAIVAGFYPQGLHLRVLGERGWEIVEAYAVHRTHNGWILSFRGRSGFYPLGNVEIVASEWSEVAP